MMLFYCGLVAVPVALIETYKITEKEELKRLIKDAVRDIFYTVIDRAKKTEKGIFWNENPAMIYDGGVLLELIEIEDFLKEESIKNFIVSGADFLLTKGYESKVGGLVFDGYDGKREYIAPNFEFGSAGTGFVLLRIYEYTGDKKYLNDIYEFTDGLESLGGPVRMSAGLWNCVNLCCGAAGQVQFFIGLYVSTGDEKWLSLARQSAGVLLGEVERDEDGDAFWPVALARINPTEYTVPLGYYDGEAGIISALLQIYALEKNEFLWSRLADDPFKTNI